MNRWWFLLMAGGFVCQGAAAAPTTSDCASMRTGRPAPADSDLSRGVWRIAQRTLNGEFRDRERFLDERHSTETIAETDVACSETLPTGGPRAFLQLGEEAADASSVASQRNSEKMSDLLQPAAFRVGRRDFAAGRGEDTIILIRETNHYPAESDQPGDAEIHLSKTVPQRDGDQSAPLAAAFARCSNGGEIVVDGTFTYSTTLNVSSGCVLRWTGAKGKLVYTGPGDAIHISDAKNITFYNPLIDITGAGASARAIHVAGLWFGDFYAPRFLVSGANQVGIYIETSKAGGDHWGAFLLNIHDIQCTAGAAGGYACVQTSKTPGDINSVTHLRVLSGWSKGLNYGLKLSNLASFKVDGFVADTAIDSIHISDSHDGVLTPGELGPATGYCINFGTNLQGLYLIAPSQAGSCTGGYENNATYTPQHFGQGEVLLFGSNADQNYFARIRSFFNYAKSFIIGVKGSGAEKEIMSYGEGQGYLGLNNATGRDTVIGKAASTNNQSSGFVYIPSVAGAPTGKPAAREGFAPLVYSATDRKLYIYNGGSWEAH